MKPDFTTEATELSVHFANPPLLVNTSGVVRLKYTGEILADKPTDTVELDWIDGKRHYSVAEIVAYTFKKLLTAPQQLRDFTVIFKDNNPNNVHPSNLYWKPKHLPIPSLQFPDAFVIPYYTRYALTKDFKLIDTVNGVVRDFYMDSGYLKIRLKSDRGNSQLIALHRLVAMTFIPVEGIVDNLVVDHIDNNKLNNAVENLQWLTPAQHIEKTNIVGDLERIGVLSKNVHTGEVVEHQSIRGAAAYYGIDYATMTNRLSHNQRLYYPGLLFQKATQLTDWREPTAEEIQKVMNSAKRPPQIKITVVSEDGTSKVFVSLRETAEYVGVPQRTIRAASEKRVPNKKRNGFLITFEKLKTGEIIKPLES